MLAVALAVSWRVTVCQRRADARAQPVQRGQRERGRLAGAGLGAAHQVAPGEHGRNGLELDRRGRVVALVAHGAEQRIGQTELIKT